MKYLLIVTLTIASLSFTWGQESTTIILLRHAEKAGEMSKDPPLTEAGKARAAELVHILANMNIDAVYSTPYLRTLHTVAPLAAANELQVNEYPPMDNDAIQKIIDAYPGGTIVFSGHSNTVPAIVNYLTGSETLTQLPEWEYDNLYILVGKEGSYKLLELQFGEPSKPE